MSIQTLLQNTEAGLYCPAGGFYIDPHRPAARAVITHAHSDHARIGSQKYLAASPGEHLLRMRMSSDAELQFLAYGETLMIGGVRISFHPAGHMLGSAQVRLEHRGKVAVITGDYKLGGDATCQKWEALACHLLVTESTFALPVYRWPAAPSVVAAINQWWRESRDQQKCCVLYGYAIGKSQRMLAALDTSIGPIYTHGAVEKGCAAYRRSGVLLPPTIPVASVTDKPNFAGAMVLAVPSAHGTSWLRRFGKTSTAMASGWMAVRGARRRRSVDRGFIFSDHVDWPELMQAISACDPDQVWATHGYSAVLARYLREQGRDAISIDSPLRGDDDDDEAA